VFSAIAYFIRVIYAGTSGWAYPAWKPAWYPAKLASSKFLTHYASRLNTVEVNYTFRRFPTEKLQLGWIEQTSPGFRFAIKAHQTITHVKRLADANAFTDSFLHALSPLRGADRLGPVLFQLPPFLKCDLERLSAFLTGLPAGTRYAFEFRHESWFTEKVYEALRLANVALCIAESETLETPDVTTADFTYLRLRKETYEIEPLKARITPHLASGDVFVYFKHEDTPDGALCAEQLLISAAPAL
jgi:uncharacterized protein YecE (DUF72 family)